MNISLKKVIPKKNNYNNFWFKIWYISVQYQSQMETDTNNLWKSKNSSKDLYNIYKILLFAVVYYNSFQSLPKIKQCGMVPICRYLDRIIIYSNHGNWTHLLEAFFHDKKFKTYSYLLWVIWEIISLKTTYYFHLTLFFLYNNK